MPQRARIAVDATSLYSPLTGVGRFTFEVLAGAARRDDIDLVAFATTLRGRSDLASLLPEGVRAVPGPPAARPMRALWRRWDHPQIERFTGPIDVVHGPNFVVPPSRGGQVVTIHDLTPVRFPELCTPDVRLLPQLIRRAIDRGALVHTVSEFVRDEVIEAFDVAPDRVVAVLNGVSPGPAGRAERGRMLAGCDRYVLAVGTVEPRKDLPSLVAAFDALAAEDPDLGLVIAGPDGWGTDELALALDRAAHRGRIHRLGWVDEQQRADLLVGAVALAFASRYEGFGLPIVEAFAVGTPVVATAAGAIPEVAGDAAVLVSPRDAAALADGLRQVTNASADERRHLAERGRDRAAAFTWDRTIDGLAALWHRAAT
jgi:glycosyltransferase involved in cell wall biosynthesis